MMWNWLVTSLAVGATVVLYDGSPIIPTPHVLLDLVDRNKYVKVVGAGWTAFTAENDKQFYIKSFTDDKFL